MDKKIINEINEDIQPIQANPCVELAEAIADKIGNCKVVGSCVYYLNEDFEIWNNDDDWTEVPFGIFFIIDVEEDKITVYNSKLETVEDVDEIGKQPLSYFARTEHIAAECKNVSELISWLDRYMGRDWFADDEDDFIDNFGGNTDEEN